MAAQLSTPCETTVHELSSEWTNECNTVTLGTFVLNGKVRLIDAQETLHGPRA